MTKAKELDGLAASALSGSQQALMVFKEKVTQYAINGPVARPNPAEYPKLTELMARLVLIDVSVKPEMTFKEWAKVYKPRKNPETGGVLYLSAYDLPTVARKTGHKVWSIDEGALEVVVGIGSQRGPYLFTTVDWPRPTNGMARVTITAEQVAQLRAESEALA